MPEKSPKRNTPVLLKKIKFSLLFLISLFFVNETQAQFVVKDELAVDPQASIFDPEYNTTLNLVCWKSPENDLWVSGIDPVTRMFKPLNGRGTYVTGNLIPNSGESLNGPEWMLSSQGTQIIMVKGLWGTRYPAIATMVLGGWYSNTLMQFPDAVYTMATSNYADSAARFLFETGDVEGIKWVKNTDLCTSYYYPDVTLGFFARDNQQICCATSKARNPGFIETSCNFPFLTLISQDTIGAPFMWLDPASGSRLFMYRTNGFKTLKIFQEMSPDFWVLYKQFNSPLAQPYDYITSPEPFTCGGKSYISFMAAQSGSGKDGLPAQIWIAGADPADTLMRRVSDSTLEIRTDPEPVVFSDSAFVYYTHVITDDNSTSQQFSVRKCVTGLANFPIQVNTKDISKAEYSVFPNPSRGNFQLSGPGIIPSGSQIEVYNLAGEKVHTAVTGNPASGFSFGFLPDGNYLLKIIQPKKESAVKFTISR